MDLRPSALLDYARSPTGQKFVKYSLVSVISVAINLVLLVFAFGIVGWSAAPARYVVSQLMRLAQGAATACTPPRDRN